MSPLIRSSIWCNVIFLIVTISLGACKEKSSSVAPTSETSNQEKTPGIPEKTVTPGPVERIETDERLEAIQLVNIQDPIDIESAVFRAEIRGAFEKKNFKLLEITAKELRKSHPLFSDGSWKLKHFYDAIGERINHEQSDYERDLSIFQAWDKAEPKSLTLRIAMIEFYTEVAWNARGNGMSDTVTQSMRQAFEQSLAIAAEILKEARSLPEKDPCCQYAGMTVALGQGWEPKDFDQLVTEIEAITPTFYPAYSYRAFSLLPKWHGKTKKSWLEYAKKVSEDPDGLGDEVYARIVINNSKHFESVFRDGGADWKKTRAGLEILKKKYPESLVILNQTARLATMANDRNLAEASFAEIGDKVLPSVWPKKERFVHFRNWARTGKW